MYTVLILLHSWLRWVVLLLGIFAVYGAVTGRFSGRAWGAKDDSAGRLYTIGFDVQFMIGLLLYLFASPIVSMAREHMAESMANSVTRFWLVEHAIGMIAAVAFAHLGRVRVRRAQTDRSRFGRAAVFYGISLLLLMLATPWPGLPYGRALLRLP
jgi:hypothetical protein